VVDDPEKMILYGEHDSLARIKIQKQVSKWLKDPSHIKYNQYLGKHENTTSPGLAKKTLETERQKLISDVDQLLKDQNDFEKKKAKFEEEKRACEKMKFKPNAVKNKDAKWPVTQHKTGKPIQKRLYKCNYQKKPNLWKNFRLIHPNCKLPKGKKQWTNSDAIGIYCLACKEEVDGYGPNRPFYNVISNHEEILCSGIIRVSFENARVCTAELERRDEQLSYSTSSKIARKEPSYSETSPSKFVLQEEQQDYQPHNFHRRLNFARNTSDKWNAKAYYDQYEDEEF
jgi:hypothetical protein